MPIVSKFINSFISRTKEKNLESITTTESTTFCAFEKWKNALINKQPLINLSQFYQNEISPSIVIFNILTSPDKQ